MCRRFRVARGPKSAFKDNGENFAIRALTSCSSRNLIEPGVDPFLKRFAKPTSNDPTLIDCLDEESDAEVTERCQKVLRFVEQRPERRIALVSHGMFLKAFIELIRPNAPEGTPRDLYADFLDNCEIRQIVRHSFVEFRESRGWPIVLAAPHGGKLAPSSIADRTKGCCEPDTASVELADVVAAAFARRGAAPPALVALHLHRQKLEANRGRAKAVDSHCAAGSGSGNPALHAWDEYHQSLERAMRDCVAAFGFCLFLDIHGQSHRDEVGVKCSRLFVQRNVTADWMHAGDRIGVPRVIF